MTKDVQANIEAQVKELTDLARGLKGKIEELEAVRKDISERIKESVSETRADLERDLKKVAEEQATLIKQVGDIANTMDELKARAENPVAAAMDGNASDAEVKDALDFIREFRMVKNFERGENFQTLERELAEIGQKDVETVKHYFSAMQKFFHAPHIQHFNASLTPDEQKALSTFTASGNGFFVSPQMATEILSCVENIYSITSLLGQVQIAKSAIKIPVDNEFDEAAWACESECFANSGNLGDGLSEKEIPANTLRYVACVTRDLLEDAGVDVQAWIAAKARDAFQRALERGVMTGDGKGMPLGIANPRSCIPIMNAKPESDGGAPAGQFTWQDLVMLKESIHSQYHGPDMAYIMSQDALSFTLTMSDANGRPLFEGILTEDYRPRLRGMPVHVSSFLPGIDTTLSPAGFPSGSTPVLVGNWRRAYLLVRRRGIAVQRDDYSAGFCVLYKFEARFGGDILCCNAARRLAVN